MNFPRVCAVTPRNELGFQRFVFVRGQLFQGDRGSYHQHPGSLRSRERTNPLEERNPVKKTLMALLLALCLAPAVSFAQVVVRIGPPAPLVERRPPPPERGYVWIAGYHNWDGNRYVWVPGRWDRPPHPGARWEAHHWVHRHDGWVLMEGHWR